jgi:hypothetical protein
MLEWHVPSSVRELWGFLGLASYYRKFVRNFSIIAKPLIGLLKKDQLFIWTSNHDTAFTVLKQALCTAPVWALPDFSLPFHIETDASGSDIGAVLQHNGHPIAFISKALSPWNQGLSIYEKEYLAILMAVEQWRHYLLQGEFYIHTDHRSLIHLNEQSLHTSWQQKVFSKLLGLQYKILYKKGSENGAANALSRRVHQDQSYAISSVSHKWRDEIQGYSSDKAAVDLLSQLAASPDSRPPFSLVQGVIRYKNRLWLGSNKTMQLKIMAALHSSPLGGHSGAPATYSKTKALFFWPGMKSDIWAYVQSCTVSACQARSISLPRSLAAASSAIRFMGSDFNGFHRRIAAIGFVQCNLGRG